MSRIVAKFGGTSVADIERIRIVAERIKQEVDLGHEVAVVVSAMAGVTNQLVEYVRSVSNLYDSREYDTVVSSGEQVTVGLLALALQELGVVARSWLGWQIPILTDKSHSFARIEKIETEELEKRLAVGEVVVAAGFQGLGDDGRITTLGRGGSDTSAVALAAALKADRCDIYTDVDGVYTADPRIVSQANKIDCITFEEMLELASVGTKVLHTRSVEMAMKYNVPLCVLSSFSNGAGTLVIEEDRELEKEIIRGVAYSKEEGRITLTGLPDKPGVSAAIFGPLAEADINVDMIVQSVSPDGKKTDQSFTLDRCHMDLAVDLIKKHYEDLQYQQLLVDSHVSKISVVGVGMRSHTGVAQVMFQTLANKGVNIMAISTSEIKISVLIAEEYTELAVRALHEAYHLGKKKD